MTLSAMHLHAVNRAPRMGATEIREEQVRLEMLLRESPPEPMKIAESISLLLIHDGGTEKTEDLYARSFAALVASDSQRALTYLTAIIDDESPKGAALIEALAHLRESTAPAAGL